MYNQNNKYISHVPLQYNLKVRSTFYLSGRHHPYGSSRTDTILSPTPSYAFHPWFWLSLTRPDNLKVRSTFYLSGRHHPYGSSRTDTVLCLNPPPPCIQFTTWLPFNRSTCSLHDPTQVVCIGQPSLFGPAQLSELSRNGPKTRIALHLHVQIPLKRRFVLQYCKG